MIQRTKAIVLRHAPISNTSRLVSWLTADSGRIMTKIKGSQRPKSPFLGQFDLFYTCELLFYAREFNGTHIARECTPLKTRIRFRSDWRACAAASYLADLASQVSAVEVPNPALFELMEFALDRLAAFGASPVFLFWLELKLLCLLGWAPRFHTCVQCGRPLPTAARGIRFSSARGGAICPNCADASATPASILTPDVLAMLRNWQAAQSPQGALCTLPTAAQFRSISELLGQFLSYHLDTPLASRGIAMRVIEDETGRGG